MKVGSLNVLSVLASGRGCHRMCTDEHFDPYTVAQIHMPVRSLVYTRSNAAQVLQVSIPIPPHSSRQPATTTNKNCVHAHPPASALHRAANEGSSGLEPSLPPSSTEHRSKLVPDSIAPKGQLSLSYTKRSPEDSLEEVFHWFSGPIDNHPLPRLCRYCSEAFHLCPHRGRYPQGGRQRSTTPDMLSMQALLAGMADRGAQAAIIEASEEGLHCGRLAGDSGF